MALTGRTTNRILNAALAALDHTPDRSQDARRLCVLWRRIERVWGAAGSCESPARVVEAAPTHA
jgi:hypothetical protein